MFLLLCIYFLCVGLCEPCYRICTFLARRKEKSEAWGRNSYLTQVLLLETGQTPRAFNALVVKEFTYIRRQMTMVLKLQMTSPYATSDVNVKKNNTKIGQ